MSELKNALNASGELVSIDRVPNGAKCGCFCPSCGGAVIAKQGDIIDWHFSHENADCKYSKETELHFLAKAVIEYQKKVPILCVNKDANDGPISCVKWFDCESVEVEKWMGKFRPDLLVSISGRKVMIEILVTHKVDSAKLQKIKESGLPCLEIDVSSFRGADSLDLVKYALLNVEDYMCYWVFNPDFEIKKRIEIDRRSKVEDFNNIINYGLVCDNSCSPSNCLCYIGAIEDDNKEWFHICFNNYNSTCKANWRAKKFSSANSMKNRLYHINKTMRADGKKARNIIFNYENQTQKQ